MNEVTATLYAALAAAAVGALNVVVSFYLSHRSSNIEGRRALISNRLEWVGKLRAATAAHLSALIALHSKRVSGKPAGDDLQLRVIEASVHFYSLVDTDEALEGILIDEVSKLDQKLQEIEVDKDIEEGVVFKGVDALKLYSVLQLIVDRELKYVEELAQGKYR